MKRTYAGGCHCSAVRFEADVDLAGGTFRCNCSICFKSRAWMAAVPGASFRLLAGEGHLHDYQFGPKRIHHLFCATCGVRPFSQGQDVNGNKFYAVRVNCLEGIEEKELVDAPIKYFDMLHDNMKTPPAEIRHL